jgi:glycosyltransferase involved in cell wall biosynthesis
MSTSQKINILAIYRGVVRVNRGTPIKVRSLAAEFDTRDDISFTLCAWDAVGPHECKRYFQLSNNHIRDIYHIFRFARQNNVDVILGHTMATYYYLWPLKFLTRAKIVLEMQGYIEEEAKLYGGINRLSYLFSKLIYGLFYRSCDLITTSSETSRDILLRFNKNVVAVWGGVDTAIFNPEVQPGNLFSRDKKDIVIGYTGNLRMWQGLPFLISSYTKLKALYPEFKLTILSSEPVIAPVSGIVYVQQIEHAEVPKFSAACDILVIPRLHNEVNRISFPSKIIEYMALGKAVVASNTSDAHKIIDTGRNGLVFEAGDEDSFIAALASLRDPSLRSALGAHAWDTVQSRFTWKKQTDIFVRHISNLFQID